MSAIFKESLKTSLLTSLYNDIKFNNNNYYYFIGHIVPWENDVIPDVENNVSNETYTRNNIIYIKKISINDLAFITPRYDWNSGIIFDKYDDLDSELHTKRFYCLTANNNVYKCIDNNNHSPSSVQPYSMSNNIIHTSDGYKWKYIYTLPVSMINKFLTNEYMPVTNSSIENYFTRGSIYSVTIANYGSGYADGTRIEVIGDGYQENNKLNISAIEITNGGYGYLNIPSVTFSDPYISTPFITNTEYLIGEYVKVENRIYKVTKGGISSNNIPTHTCICGNPISNGTLELLFVGKTISGSLILDDTDNFKIKQINVSGFVGEIIINNSGYGYSSTPEVIISDSFGTHATETTATCTAIILNNRVSSIDITNIGGDYINGQQYNVSIAPPFLNSINFSENLSIDDGDIIKQDDRYYEAKTSGLLGANTPIHKSGSLINGTVVLEYVGQQAYATPNIFYGYGYSTDPIATIEEPLLISLKNEDNYTVFPVDSTIINVVPKQILQAGDKYYLVENSGSLGLYNTPNHISGTVSYNGVDLTYLCTIKRIVDTPVDVLTNDFVLLLDYDRYYQATEDSTIITIPTHLSGTYDNLSYISLNYPNISIVSRKTEAIFSAIIENGQITGAICHNPGIGYTHAYMNIIDAYTGSGENAVIIPNIAQKNSNTKQLSVEMSAIPGAIDTIKILNGGTGYNTTPILTVQGDGSNCQLTATLTYGSISSVNIISSGYNYTNANIIIHRDINDSGLDANIVPIISPQSGHGKNPVSELYCSSLAINTNLNYEKVNGYNIIREYHQFGIIKNPNIYYTNLRYNGLIGSACYSAMAEINNELDYSIPLNDINNNIYIILSENFVQGYENMRYLLIQSLNNKKLDNNTILFQGTGQSIKSIKIMEINYPEIDKHSGDILLLDNRESFVTNLEQNVSLKTIINL